MCDQNTTGVQKQAKIEEESYISFFLTEKKKHERGPKVPLSHGKRKVKVNVTEGRSLRSLRPLRGHRRSGSLRSPTRQGARCARLLKKPNKPPPPATKRVAPRRNRIHLRPSAARPRPNGSTNPSAPGPFHTATDDAARWLLVSRPTGRAARPLLLRRAAPACLSRRTPPGWHAAATSARGGPRRSWRTTVVSAAPRVRWRHRAPP